MTTHKDTERTRLRDPEADYKAMYEARKNWVRALAAANLPFPGEIGTASYARGYLDALASSEERKDAERLLDESGKFFDWGNAASIAFKNLLDAYERRLRSLCQTQEELDKKPWECAEFIEAARILREKPNWFIAIDASMKGSK